ncbi:MAG TPA: hypothetical protein VJX67_06115 [Blastocatellia bacterium]|nr:hypothetical protein [Blastocatellia bacterium]
MAGICDRCNEKTSQLMNIAVLPEMASVIHLGYRNVCMDCYDDLLAEARQDLTADAGEGTEPAMEVSIQARVEGNTSHLDPFSDETIIDEITPTGLTFTTKRDLDAGAVLKIGVPSYALEFTAIVEDVFSEGNLNTVDLRLVDQSDGWDKLWSDFSSGQR